MGIVLIRSGREVGGPAEPYPVGTVASVQQVMPLGDGSFQVICLGVKRFAIRRIVALRPYLQAEIAEMPDQEDLEAAQELMRKALDLFNTYINLTVSLTNRPAPLLSVALGPSLLSYAIASRLDISLDEKQALLEERSAAARLRQVIRMIKREQELMKFFAVHMGAEEDWEEEEEDDTGFSLN
jgi:Lon protease-like protein